MLKDISLYTKKYQKKISSESIILKTTKEIDHLRESAHIVRDLLYQLHKIIKPGTNELDITSFCENYITLREADPVLKTSGLYPHAALISRNNIAFHGIPSDMILREGDIITIDVVLVKNGWFGDGAWTYEVGQCHPSLRELVHFSHEIIYKCVTALEDTYDLSSIAGIIEKNCRSNKFRVLEEGAGHGIGRQLHEEPQILFHSKAESVPLKKGMVFTIEPVITNSPEILEYTDEGEAYVPSGYFTAQFEHMVAVNDRGLEILTNRNLLF
ncbi:MAG: type I methionyl aminopeptidase [Spirochaetaceae bacterium]|nr:type I methionyl aminopeptidase [Spirochaetaceae bacterium]